MEPTKNNPPSILSSVEGEFTKNAQADRAETLPVLTAKAAECTKPTPVFEGSWMLIILFTFFGILSSYYLVRTGPSLGRLLLPLSLFAIAAFIQIRSKTALFVLEKDGLLLGRSLKAVIPWTSVADYEVVVNRTNGLTIAVYVTFYLTDGYTPPEFSASRRMKYNKKKNLIGIHMLGLRKINSDDLAKKIGAYIDSGYARAELAGYDDPKSVSK